MSEDQLLQQLEATSSPLRGGWGGGGMGRSWDGEVGWGGGGMGRSWDGGVGWGGGGMGGGGMVRR